MSVFEKRIKLNTIYFTSITQKAYGTYKRVLEGTGVGVYSLTWWRRPNNPGNTTELGRARE